jgi:hypothetical protein
MPESVDEVTVQTRKDGKFGYILFTPQYSLATLLKTMELQVIIEYEEGFMKAGMGEAYTVRMLTNEFWALTQNCWEFAPIGAVRREIDGTPVHGVTWDFKEHRAITALDEKVEPPPKILEERGRGTVIRNLTSQGKLLQYWAWSQTAIEVGVYVPHAHWAVEYWMNLKLQAVPDDEDPAIFSQPPMPDDQIREIPTILFGPRVYLQERYDDEEVQGGKIALIPFEHFRVQKPPNGLDRMHSTFLKQVAYNQRVMEAEDQIAGINCDVPHFLSDMTLDPEQRVIICVNSSEEMKRDEEDIGGQLWIQGDRQMTASNKVFEGMANTRESAVITAAAEAVSWRHALELDGPRKGQRVIIFPKDVPHLDAFLSSRDPNISEDDGHPIAFSTILQHSQTFENPPQFWREDSEPITSDEFLSEKVPEWMATTKQVATGNRRRVLENGPDKVKSDDEEDPDMKPDELTGMYTSEMDPEKGPIKLTQAQVAAQKATAHALKASKLPPRSQTPVDGSSDDDDPNGSQIVWSMSKSVFRRNKHWVDPNAPKALPAPESQKALPAPPSQLALPAPPPQKALPAPRKDEGTPVTRSRAVTGPTSRFEQPRKPTPVSSDTEDQSEMTEDQKRLARFGKKKAAASPRAPADNSTKEAKTSHPMATRSKEASRAGGLRGVVGSGSTGYVCDKSSPSSKPGS